MSQNTTARRNFFALFKVYFELKKSQIPLVVTLPHISLVVSQISMLPMFLHPINKMLICRRDFIFSEFYKGSFSCGFLLKSNLTLLLEEYPHNLRPLQFRATATTISKILPHTQKPHIFKN